MFENENISIRYGGLDQRLFMGGGVFRTPRLFLAFFGHISGHMEPLLTNKQLKELISDPLEKIKIILKIGRVIAIFPSRIKFYSKLPKNF